MSDWLTEVRAEFDALFELDWRTRVAYLNKRHGLNGDVAFRSSRWAPEFFYGPLHSFERGRWVAVLSLNPHSASDEDVQWHERQEWTADAYWRFLTRQDLRGFDEDAFFYAPFARRLVLLARAAMRQDLASLDEGAFLMSRMAVFESIPYASRKYRTGLISELYSQRDVGCLFARHLWYSAVVGCPPAAILVNGNDAVFAFAEIQEGWEWREVRYPSAHRPEKSLRHWEGVLRTPNGASIPVIGFPQRAQGSHNAAVEIEQLASYVQESVARD